MTIDEAIAILTYWDEDIDAWNNEDNCAAVQLGIEALKRHQDKQARTFAGMLEPLPGETSD